jgi:Acyl-CoA thioesterase N-terminal domain
VVRADRPRRGPRDPEASHAGPPAGLSVRAMERALPRVRLARVTVDLAKPIPFAGFHVDVEVTRAVIVDGEERGSA